jgi:hypothetical protein
MVMYIPSTIWKEAIVFLHNYFVSCGHGDDLAHDSVLSVVNIDLEVVLERDVLPMLAVSWYQ